VIPSFIMSEAGRVKESMLHVIEKYQAKVIAAAAARDGDNGTVMEELKKDVVSEFNASKYLFVSSRIARSFPSLKASTLVQEFNTPLPKKPYGVAERDATRAYRMKLRITALVNSMGVLLMVFLGYLSSLPASLHDMLIDCLGWCFYGYISLLHVILYKKNPLYGYTVCCTAVLSKRQDCKVPTRAGCDYTAGATVCGGRGEHFGAL
jgi:hypothetical protein